MKKIILVLALFLILPRVTHATDLKIAVGTTALNDVFNKIVIPFEKESGLKLVYDRNGLGSDQVFKQVDQGLVEGGAGAAPFEDWVELMISENYPIKDKNEFKWRTIGGDRILIFTHKEVGVTRLSEEQIRDIFSKKVKNWIQLGGKDIPIVIGLTSKLVATEKFFVKHTLQNISIDHSKVKNFENGDLLEEWVAKTPGAICFGPTGFGKKDLKVIESYELRRPLTFLTKGRPSEKIEKLLKFIVEKGPQYGVVR